MYGNCVYVTLNGCFTSKTKWFHSSPGLPVESIRLRFAFLQDLNNSLETSFLPLIDLRPANVYSRSTAFVLSQLRSLVFYNTKVRQLQRLQEHFCGSVIRNDTCCKLWNISFNNFFSGQLYKQNTECLR